MRVRGWTTALLGRERAHRRQRLTKVRSARARPGGIAWCLARTVEEVDCRCRRWIAEASREERERPVLKQFASEEYRDPTE